MISDRIRDLRNALGLSAEQFADDLQISRNTLVRWESGDSYPSASHLVDICRKCSITPDQFYQEAVAAGSDSDNRTVAELDRLMSSDAGYLSTLGEYAAIFIFAVLAVSIRDKGVPLAGLGLFWAVKTKKNVFFIILIVLVLLNCLIFLNENLQILHRMGVI